MQRIFIFFISNTVRLLFWFYMLIAIGLTFGDNLYFKSSFLNTSNQVSGGIHSFFNGIGVYFSLSKENYFLQEQNRLLQEELSQLRYKSLPSADSLKIATYSMQAFQYKKGYIIKNSYTAINNYLTLSLGKNDSVFQDMGVVNEKGIIGIVESSGSKFSKIQSILNSNSKINAKIKGTDFFGSLVWNSADPNLVQLIDIPDLAPIKKGDTIITGGMSSIFPALLPIGVIKDFKLTPAKNYYQVEVRLFNNMQNIGPVYVIKNLNKMAIDSLEKKPNE